MSRPFKEPTYAFVSVAILAQGMIPSTAFRSVRCGGDLEAKIFLSAFWLKTSVVPRDGWALEIFASSTRRCP
eukprot:2966745-Amphidinium_carterae.2